MIYDCSGVSMLRGPVFIPTEMHPVKTGLISIDNIFPNPRSYNSYFYIDINILNIFLYKIDSKYYYCFIMFFGSMPPPPPQKKNPYQAGRCNIINIMRKRYNLKRFKIIKIAECKPINASNCALFKIFSRKPLVSGRLQFISICFYKK